MDVINSLDRTIQGSPEDAIPTKEIAALTMEAAKSKLREVQRDVGVARSFQFLLLLSVAARQENPQAVLAEYGLVIPELVSPLALSVALRAWLQPTEQQANPEYATIARQATVDTIAEWHQANTIGQRRLFGNDTDPFESWRRASQAGGFSELSRTFFAKFTGRYLNYFLSRAASATLSTTEQRDRFDVALSNHIDQISRHAFETSKITQSFAAGWFNNNAQQELPSDDKIKGFLGLAFSKIREELRREGAA